MSTIYLVEGNSGSYEDYGTWIVRAELTKEAAERHIALCLKQLDEKFDKLDPYPTAQFTIEADPHVSLSPFFGGSIPPKVEGDPPGEWYEHGVGYTVLPVELHDGVHDLVVLHRCHKFV